MEKDRNKPDFKFKLDVRMSGELLEKLIWLCLTGGGAALAATHWM